MSLELMDTDASQGPTLKQWVAQLQTQIVAMAMV